MHFLNLFSSESYHVSRFISKDFEAKLVEMITSTDYDVIQLETLYLTPYIDIIKKHSTAIVAMRAHNIEHEIWDRITQNTKSIARKAYLKILTQRLKDYELNHLNDNDYLITVSDRDLDKYLHTSCLQVVLPSAPLEGECMPDCSNLCVQRVSVGLLSNKRSLI